MKAKHSLVNKLVCHHEHHDCDSKLAAWFSNTKFVPLLQAVDAVQRQYDYAPAHLRRLEELLHERDEFT